MKDGERNTYADMGDDPAYAPTRQERADAQWRRYQRLCALGDAERERQAQQQASTEAPNHD